MVEGLQTLVSCLWSQWKVESQDLGAIGPDTLALVRGPPTVHHLRCTGPSTATLLEFKSLRISSKNIW